MTTVPCSSCAKQRSETKSANDTAEKLSGLKSTCERCRGSRRIVMATLLIVAMWFAVAYAAGGFEPCTKCSQAQSHSIG